MHLIYKSLVQLEILTIVTLVRLWYQDLAVEDFVYLDYLFGAVDNNSY